MTSDLWGWFISCVRNRKVLIRSVWKWFHYYLIWRLGLSWQPGAFPSSSRLHFSQTWLRVRPVPASCQTLLMFLERLPGPCEPGSVLRALRSPTCNGGRQWPPVSPASQIDFPWRPAPCADALLANRGDALDGDQLFQQDPSKAWRPDGLAHPAVRLPAAAAAANWKNRPVSLSSGEKRK